MPHGVRRRRARTSRRVRLLRQQAAHDGGGADGHDGRPRPTRSASTPSATRAGRPTWTGSTTTASASTIACPSSPARSASPNSSACEEMLAQRAPRGRRTTARRSPGSRASQLPCRGHGRRRARLVRVRRAAPARWIATPTIQALRGSRVQSKPYLPAIHLMSFYRERLRPSRGRVSRL